MKNLRILNRILAIFFTLILIISLFTLIMGFNDIKNDMLSLYLEISRILFIISILIFFSGKKKLISMGFYILIFSMIGNVIEVVREFVIRDIIILIFGIYIIYLYIKNLVYYEYKPMIKILTLVFPNEWSYKYKLAIIKLREKNIDGSIHYLNEAQKLGASNNYYNRLYGRILLENKNYEEAIKILKNAYVENNEDIASLSYIGYAYVEIGELSKAIQYFSKYLDTNDNVEILYNRACLLAEIEKYDDAIRDYTRILDIDKERSDILYNRGLLYEKINKHEKSIEDFHNSINMKNPDPKAYIAMGNYEREKGNSEKAKKLYLKGIKLQKELIEYIPEEYLENGR